MIRCTRLQQAGSVTRPPAPTCRLPRKQALCRPIAVPCSRLPQCLSLHVLRGCAYKVGLYEISASEAASEVELQVLSCDSITSHDSYSSLFRVRLPIATSICSKHARAFNNQSLLLYLHLTPLHMSFHLFQCSKCASTSCASTVDQRS